MVPTIRSSDAVDRTDPTPLHFQIRERILQRIHESYRPGDQLPPEPELCEDFGVSRSTLRKAVDGLVSEGVLHRERPKGTFVALGATEGDLTSLRSIWEDFRRLGMNPTIRIESAQIVQNPGVAAFLDREPEMPLLELRRVYSVGGEPVVIDHSWLSAQEHGWLLDEDLTGSWFELLEARDGPCIDHARQIVSAQSADFEVASMLLVPVGAALLEVRRQIYRYDGRPIAYSHAWYRGDRYSFSVGLPRRRPSRTQERNK